MKIPLQDQIINNLASIKERWQKIKAGQGRNLFVLACLVLVAFLAFGVYNLAQIYARRAPVRVERVQSPGPAHGEPARAVSLPTEGFVASRNGTKYHLPWCPGASTIKPENIIVFETEAQAQSAGYGPAANCPGI